MSGKSDVIPYTVERHIQLGRVSAIAPSPCGSWVAVAMERLDSKGTRYVSDLWRVPLDGGEPLQLTRGDSRDAAPCFRRDGALGFLSDRRPNEGDSGKEDERTQVWLLPAVGEPRRLTDEPLGVSAFRFARAADRLVVLASVLPGVAHEQQRETADDRRKNGPTALRYDRMPVRYWDHWLPDAAPHVVAYDGEGGGRRDLTPTADREHREADFDVSPDGRYVVITHRLPGTDRIEEDALTLIDLASAESSTLLHVPFGSLRTPRFDPSSRRVAAVCELRRKAASSLVRLRVVDLASRKATEPASDWDRWPILGCWVEDGSALFVTADDQGHVPVFRVPLEGAVERLTAPSSAGGHVEIAACGEGVVGLRSTALHPPEPFALAAAGEPRILAWLSGLKPEETKSFATFEQRLVENGDHTVPTHLLRPAGATRERPAPALIWIHGGPMTAWSDTWHWRWNPLLAVARGYAVALPNPAGSTGFGQDTVEAIWGNTWGARCYEDILAVADDLGRHPAIDASRMAAMGGSFGGYMANWIGANTDRFACLVTHASIFGIASFYGDTDYPPWLIHELGLSPYTELEAFERFSPSRFVSRWKTPTLVIHGEKDYRVSIGQALALFEALVHHGVSARLLVFPDENHWINRPRNIVAWYEDVLGFLDEHLTRERGEPLDPDERR